MPNTSSKTKVVAYRVLVEVYDIIERRAKNQSKSVGDYMKARAIYDVTRKHGKGRRVNA